MSDKLGSRATQGKRFEAGVLSGHIRADLGAPVSKRLKRDAIKRGDNPVGFREI
jgi:hypothetical protein